MRKQYVTYGAAGLALIAAVVAVLNLGAIKQQLNDWKLLPQPERLSELYFVNHATLPTTYTPGSAQQFSFVVHNLEYRSTDYQYVVSEAADDGSQQQQLSSGSFSLDQDARHIATINEPLADLGSEVKIITTITVISGHTSSKQTIYYRVTREGL